MVERQSPAYKNGAGGPWIFSHVAKTYASGDKKVQICHNEFNLLN